MNKILKIVLIVFGIWFGIVMLLVMFSPDSEYSNTEDKGDLTMACIMAENYVTPNLKSPGSAEFQGCQKQKYGGATVIYDGDGLYFVHGYVDSQNSFGAMLRTTYFVELKDMGNSQWTLINLELD